MRASTTAISPDRGERALSKPFQIGNYPRRSRGNPMAEEYNDADDYEGEDGSQEEFEKPAWLREMPYWAISAVLHLILVLIMVAVVVYEEKPKKEEIDITVRQKQKPPDYDPTLRRDIKKTPKILEKRIKDPIIQRKIDEVTPDIPKGTDLDKLTNMHLNAMSINASIGVGGGAAGAYGERTGKGSLIREGGSEGTEEAVRAALEWLRRHQNENGSWGSKNFTQRCKKICRNENPKRYGDGKGFEDHDVGVTALAILAFTGYGHTHRYGIYKEYVDLLKKTVRYMKSVQVRSTDPETNGRYGTYHEDTEQWIYDHAIATMAMGELLVMSNDMIGLKTSVTDAVKLILRAQNDGFGWRYEPKYGDNDTSVTGWMVLALKTAKNARPRLDIPRSAYNTAFAGAPTWFNRATATNGKTGYMVPGDAGSQLKDVYPEDPYPYSKELSCMTAVGVLCRLFAGESRKTRTVRDGVAILMRQPPKWLEQKGRLQSTINLYYWYYGSYAMFQYGGQDWRRWNESMIKSLVTTQRQGNIDEDGSWDPIGEWGAPGGRVYSTALGAMTLEVYYRFRRAQEGIGF